MANAIEIHILDMFIRTLRESFNLKIPDLNIDQLIRLSANQPPYYGYPLWANILRDIAKGLQHKTEIVEMKRKKTPIESL